MRHADPLRTCSHRYGTVLTQVFHVWTLADTIKGATLCVVAPIIAVAVSSGDVTIDDRHPPISLHPSTPQPRHGAAPSFVRYQPPALPAASHARRRIGNPPFPFPDDGSA